MSQPTAPSSYNPPPPPAPAVPEAIAAEPVQEFDDAWAEVRGDDAIQYTPEKPDPPEVSEPPEWLTSLSEWFSETFGGLAPFVAGSWGAIRIFLIAMLVLGIVVLLWKFVWPLIRDYRREESFEEEWVPEQSAARQLLDEADALAAKGEYDEAAHLLLYRSIEDIQRNRPQLLRPSNTTREIGRFDALSQGARDTFAIIASHVERSLFATRPLDAAAWHESREAYGKFAFKGNWT